ncbi:MAG: BMC domain-containing protein [Deltaproteobacteria bacterium]|jgi:microcompartment protein CcmL/EutN|nr:BMC domain-containing protein [Deltaproteobacteria bacterium]
MSTALGLVEFKTVPVGLEATDEMLKAAEVVLVLATPICPGKFVTVVSGQVANVTTSVNKAVDRAGHFLVESHVLTNVDDAVLPALSGTTEPSRLESLGVVETFAAVTAVRAGDTVAKAANVVLLDIRLARGLGGKGEVIFTGELGQVEAARKAVEERLGQDGGLVSSVVIARPHKDLWAAVV